MAKLKLGIIVGSNRRESINRKLAGALAQLGADAFEARFIQIDDLPMYNQDNEQPLPDKVARFKTAVEGSDALIFVTPEHNRSIPAVLKNAIDWGGRPYGNQGLHLMGGEAYIQFKPELIDAKGMITDESVRKFLKSFIDQFATFAGRFASHADVVAA